MIRRDECNIPEFPPCPPLSNASNPMTMPTGVVTANSTASVGFNHENLRLLCGVVVSEGNCEGAGRPAMRMPRERPSKRLWKTIAVTREAGDVVVVSVWWEGGGAREGREGGRTEICTGSDGECEAYHERMYHNAHLQNLEWSVNY